MRRHIGTPTDAQSTLRRLTSHLAHVRRRITRLLRTLRRHGILERTLCGKVIAAANTAFNLHLLERLGLLILLWSLLLRRTGLKSHLRSEDDVLAEGGGVHAWARRLAGFGPHFRPVPALGYAGVFFLLYHGAADALGAAHFFAFFVEENGYYCFCAVFVAGDLGRGDRGREIGLLILGPIGAAGSVLHVGCHGG